MKTPAVLLIMALALTMQACGVKNQLVTPDGKEQPRDQPNPSQPRYPIGR
jgi:predicted small lipoprotein YifL